MVVEAVEVVVVVGEWGGHRGLCYFLSKGVCCWICVSESRSK